MILYYIVFQSIVFYKFLFFFLFKTVLLILIIYNLYFHVHYSDHNSLLVNKHSIFNHIIFSNGFIHDSQPFYFRNLKNNRKYYSNNITSHINSLNSLNFHPNSSLNETHDSNTTDSLEKTHDSTNSEQKPNLDELIEATPGDITDSDIWRMKAAISQNSTLGIDWVNMIKTLQTSSYCTVSPLTIAYNSALSAAERNCNAELTLSIIDDMKKRSEKVIDAVTYKIAILTCVKCNRVDDALKLKDEMLETGLSIDHGTIRSLLWLLSRNGHGEEAIKLLEILKKLANLSNNEKALEQADFLNTIESCLLSNMYNDAVDIYHQLKKLDDFKLDSKSLTTLLELANRTADSELCMDLYTKAAKDESFELSSNHYNLIISTLLTNGDSVAIHTLWKKLINEPNLLDRNVCQLVLESYSMEGDFKNSYEILTLMDKETLLASTQPYLLAIKSCEKCGEWNLALKILRMAQNRLERDDIKLYNGVLAVCMVAKEWDTMASLHKEIFKESDSNTEKYEIKNNNLMPNGDTIAYLLITFYNLDNKEMINSLMSIPVVDTPLLSKIKNSLKQQ